MCLKATHVPLQVMDLHVKYTMCTLQDMDLNQKFIQSVTDGQEE